MYYIRDGSVGEMKNVFTSAGRRFEFWKVKSMFQVPDVRKICKYTRQLLHSSWKLKNTYLPI